MTWLHEAWHWYWANIWVTVRWYARAAQHIDRWMILRASDDELHVTHPNAYRKGCRLIEVWPEWVMHGIHEHDAAGSCILGRPLGVLERR